MNLMFTGNFDTEANYDKVIIYDGMGDSAAMLGSELSGNNNNNNNNNNDNNNNNNNNTPLE